MLKRYWHACKTPGRNSVDYNTRQMRWELWFVAGRCCLLKAVNAALLGEAVGPLCLFFTSCTPRIWCPNDGTLEFDTALLLMLFVEITTSKQEISSAVLLLSKLLVRSSYLILGKTMIVRKQQQQQKTGGRRMWAAEGRLSRGVRIRSKASLMRTGTERHLEVVTWEGASACNPVVRRWFRKWRRFL